MNAAARIKTVTAITGTRDERVFEWSFLTTRGFGFGVYEGT